MSSIQKVLTIVKNTFREAIRDRVLYNLIVFVLLITASAVFLGELTAGKEARTIVNLGLTTIRVFGAFIAIFVGVSLVSKEIEKRTLYSIFSKPIGRGEFLVGKFLGLCLTLLINTIIMGVGVTIALFYVGGSVLVVPAWTAIFLIFFELTIITAVAILFSSFSSPALSALLTFLVFIIGHFSASLRDFSETLGSQAANAFFSAVYYLLPNLSLFTFTTDAANGNAVPYSIMGASALYAIIYSAILLILAVLIFSRRNLK